MRFLGENILAIFAVALATTPLSLSNASPGSSPLSVLPHPKPLASPENPLLVSRSLRRRRADLFKISASNRRSSTLVSPRLVRAQRIFLTRPTEPVPLITEQVSTRVSVSESVGRPVGGPLAQFSGPQDISKRVRLVSRRKLVPRVSDSRVESTTPLTSRFEDFRRSIATATESSDNGATFGPDTERPLVLPQFLVPRTFINRLFADDAADSPSGKFPQLTILPRSFSFSCEGRRAGFYADPQYGCQVYHNCLQDGRLYSHMCGVGTVFNQKSLVCDHYYNYDCASSAEQDYSSNNVLYDENGNYLF